MRFPLPTLLASVPLAALLTGCAMAPMGSTNSLSSDSVSKTVSGTARGGQQPVVGATIAVYTFGTTGYGSTGTLLGTTTTDKNGDFTISYTCPTASTPVYALSIGGTNGYGNQSNAAIVEGAGLGTCSTAEAAPFVIINEISTVMLGTALSHFFSSTITDGTTTDHFGSPASLTSAIARVNDVLIPAVINLPGGYPNTSTSTMTIESDKIITMGNILANCVNSAGPTSYPCTVLFADTTPTGGTAPTNVLEAAVNMAKNPAANVQQLYGLSGSGAFAGGLTAYPTDWTIAVSYTASNMGLGVNTRTVSNLDIDSTGRVWFPSNKTGAVGVAYFDPGSLTFSSVYTAPGLVRPEQVVLDLNGYAWATDIGSDIVAAFPTANPGSPMELTLAGTTSTAITVLDNDNLRVGVVFTGTGYPGLAQINNSTGTSSGTYSYTTVPGASIPASGFIASSLAGDSIGGLAALANYTGGLQSYGYYVTSTNGFNFVVSQNEDLNQAVFTGTDFVVARGGYTPQGDGICIYSTQACYSMQVETATRHPSGMVIDGGAGLWLADNATPDVEFIPKNGASYLDASSVPANQIYVHGTGNGGTMSNPSGIGVDNTGNVWVSNLGCYGNGCSPAPFVLTEIIGAGTPTINPVSAQVVLGTRGGAGTEPQ